MRVSVHRRRAAVYICDDTDSIGIPTHWPTPDLYCQVCGEYLIPKPGTGKQYVCAGGKKKKSGCQKVLRYAREHGVSIEEAKQKCKAWRPLDYGVLT